MGSVDVIVPCYRYGHFLKECVGSVLSQSGADVRVLIIDDASPDDSAEMAAQIAQSDSRVTFIHHLSNKGHIATYNEGIEWASADYLLLLSADDYLLPGALNRAVKLMDANPEIAFTFGNALERDSAGEEALVNNVRKTCTVSGLRFIEMSGSRNIVPTPTAVVRTKIQHKVGGYRAELKHSGDMEMWLRLAAHGAVGMVEEYQAVYRRHAANMSLDYRADGMLPDILQREAALDHFFRTCGIDPNISRLKPRFDRELACIAVGYASSAFNLGKMSAAQDLCDFAQRACPSVRYSFAWMKFAGKRYMGHRVWNALSGAAVRGPSR